jgi:hypothetical protein
VIIAALAMQTVIEVAVLATIICLAKPKRRPVTIREEARRAGVMCA